MLISSSNIITKIFRSLAVLFARTFILSCLVNEQQCGPASCARWHALSTMFAGGADITPDHFDWFFYQGRAFGIHVDLNSGTLCSGKMILGSYMKKPLWVDHSATTVRSPSRVLFCHRRGDHSPPHHHLSRLPSQVFHLLTSSVNVVIDGCGSRFHPAQAFEVPCGKKSTMSRVSRSFGLSKPCVGLIALAAVFTGQAYSIQNVSAQPAVLYFTRMYLESSD